MPTCLVCLQLTITTSTCVHSCLVVFYTVCMCIIVCVCVLGMLLCACAACLPVCVCACADCMVLCTCTSNRLCCTCTQRDACRLLVKYHCIMCMCSVIQNSVIFLCTGTSTFKVKSQKLIDILLYKKVKGTFFLGNLMTLNAS